MVARCKPGGRPCGLLEPQHRRLPGRPVTKAPAPARTTRFFARHTPTRSAAKPLQLAASPGPRPAAEERFPVRPRTGIWQSSFTVRRARTWRVRGAGARAARHPQPRGDGPGAGTPPSEILGALLPRWRPHRWAEDVIGRAAGGHGYQREPPPAACRTSGGTRRDGRVRELSTMRSSSKGAVSAARDSGLSDG